MAAQPLREWKTGLFDCFEDASTCCYGFWCCPCLACTVSGRVGENSCLPLCDLCSVAVGAGCGIYILVPPVAVSLRSSIRSRYGIKGSICDDIAISCFCLTCSWCQMHREIKDLNKNRVAIINTQPLPVMMMAQPAMMMAQPPMAVIQHGVIVTS
ncbi:placenta-specific gene 8 protein-like [Pleuronectes platessa]|uniref:placenta-specific gene 8 protein-like n=1 Tax=Pleuronectes platessa TaxID=8262 RepID=UPI00232A77B0|nr:placenta-specific gene 8 protein-like [Pleuronectes platessa]